MVIFFDYVTDEQLASLYRNACFLVYGYRNRGTYEGKVGIALYEYDGVNKVIDEQMFISSNKTACFFS